MKFLFIMGKSALCLTWIVIILSFSFSSLAKRATKGMSQDHEDPHPTRVVATHPEERNATKKELVPYFEDPEQTVTVTETRFVTVTVTPATKCYLTTTEILTRYLTTYSEAPTVTETATRTTALETAVTLQVTATATETTTTVLSTQATTSLQETTQVVTTETTEVAVTDTSTVVLTVTTPYTVTSTVVTTQTPTPFVLVEKAAKKRDSVQQRYRRVKRSWYTKLVPQFVKKWMGMQE